MPSNFEKMGMPLNTRQRLRGYVCLPFRAVLTLVASFLLIEYPKWTVPVLGLLLGAGAVWVSMRLSDPVWWDRRVHLFFLVLSSLLLFVPNNQLIHYIVICLLWLDFLYSLQLKFPEK